ncbi:hypothetical protein GGX14DRAFT_468034, partial [Mycena pura]
MTRLTSLRSRSRPGIVIKTRPMAERSTCAMLLEPPHPLSQNNPDGRQTWRHMKCILQIPTRCISPDRTYRQTRMNAAQDPRRARRLLRGGGRGPVGRPQCVSENLQWEALVNVLRARAKVRVARLLTLKFFFSRSRRCIVTRPPIWTHTYAVRTPSSAYVCVLQRRCRANVHTSSQICRSARGCVFCGYYGSRRVTFRRLHTLRVRFRHGALATDALPKVWHVCNSCLLCACIHSYVVQISFLF